MPVTADSTVATRKLRLPYRARLTKGSARVALVTTQPSKPVMASAAKVMINGESNQSLELPSSRKIVKPPRPIAMKAIPSQSAFHNCFNCIGSRSRPYNMPAISSAPGTQLM